MTSKLRQHLALRFAQFVNDRLSRRARSAFAPGRHHPRDAAKSLSRRVVGKAVGRASVLQQQRGSRIARDVMSARGPSGRRPFNFMGRFRCSGGSSVELSNAAKQMALADRCLGRNQDRSLKTQIKFACSGLTPPANPCAAAIMRAFARRGVTARRPRPGWRGP